jgi:hypothetical protein
MIDRRLPHVESRFPGTLWQVKARLAAAVLGDTYFTYFCAADNHGSIFFAPGKATRKYGPGEGIGTLDYDVKSISIYEWTNDGYFCYP